MKKQSTQFLRRELASASNIVILGIGNESNDNDSIGLSVAKELEKALFSDKCHIFLAGTVPENLTGGIRKMAPSHVIFLDAVDMGKEPGAVEVIDQDSITNAGYSTHTISLSLLADYLTQEIGCKVIILGIQCEANSLQGRMFSLRKATEQVLSLMPD